VLMLKIKKIYFNIFSSKKHSTPQYHINTLNKKKLQ